MDGVRRFSSEAEAIAFDASLFRPVHPSPIAGSLPSAAAGDGIYTYETRGGTRGDAEHDHDNQRRRPGSEDPAEIG
jgi:hypothetical protein